MKEHIVYLSLGTNIGNRVANLREAISSLSPQLDVKTKSKVYETPPWGYTNQDKFLNQSVKAITYLDPEPLLKHLKRLEIALGREKTFRYGPRLIDIDILFFDDIMLATPNLIIPHPNVHERGFVLLPLMDIAPDVYHPVKKKTVRELVSLVDTREIVLYQPRSK